MDYECCLQTSAVAWLSFDPFSRREAERNPTQYEQTRHAFAQHLLRLITEEGFAVKDWDNGETWSICDEHSALSYLDYLEDRDGVNHIHRRPVTIYIHSTLRRSEYAKKRM